MIETISIWYAIGYLVAFIIGSLRIAFDGNVARCYADFDYYFEKIWSQAIIALGSWLTILGFVMTFIVIKIKDFKCKRKDKK